jgi:hypothetical protein
VADDKKPPEPPVVAVKESVRLNMQRLRIAAPDGCSARLSQPQLPDFLPAITDR